jgi:hypothetical protein
MGRGSVNKKGDNIDRPPTIKECKEFNRAYNKWHRKRYGNNDDKDIRERTGEEESGRDKASS